MTKKLKCGDKVVVITGSEKSKIGSVKLIHGQYAVIENVKVRTVKRRSSDNGSTGFVDKRIESKIHISNISLINEG